MHYAPLLLPGAGLIALGVAIPPDGSAGLVAHVTLAAAGLVFLLLAAVFLIANVIGAVHCRRRPVVAAGPLATPRQGSPW